MTATIAKIPPAKTVPNGKDDLRVLIAELTDRMVKTLDRPPEDSAANGSDTATFKELRDALDTVCGVYRLLYSTGDLDQTGSALAEYQKELKNGRNSGRR